MTKITQINKGVLLISEPFLDDPNFERSVVLICDHNESGSIGFVLNQQSNLLLDDVVEENIYPEIPLYIGGPVEQNYLHFIHTRGDLFEESEEIINGLFWGGDFSKAKTLLNSEVLKPTEIRCFLGYSGWDVEQLAGEIAKNSWIVTHTSTDFIFNTPAKEFWRSILRNMGGDFKVLSNYPIDPSLN